MIKTRLHRQLSCDFEQQLCTRDMTMGRVSLLWLLAALHVDFGSGGWPNVHGVRTPCMLRHAAASIQMTVRIQSWHSLALLRDCASKCVEVQSSTP